MKEQDLPAYDTLKAQQQAKLPKWKDKTPQHFQRLYPEHAGSLYVLVSSKGRDARPK